MACRWTGNLDCVLDKWHIFWSNGTMHKAGILSRRRLDVLELESWCRRYSSSTENVELLWCPCDVQILFGVQSEFMQVRTSSSHWWWNFLWRPRSSHARIIRRCLYVGFVALGEHIIPHSIYISNMVSDSQTIGLNPPPSSWTAVLNDKFYIYYRCIFRV